MGLAYFEAPPRRTINNRRSQVNSLVTSATKRYSDSADDLETVCCLRVFHEPGEHPSIIKYPVMERRDIGHAA